jgi:hypothetical protein
MHLCLVIQDSGHGGQIVDTTGQKEDGYNEGNASQLTIIALLTFLLNLVIFPLDYRKNGYIVDEVRNSFLLLWHYLTIHPPRNCMRTWWVTLISMTSCGLRRLCLQVTPLPEACRLLVRLHLYACIRWAEALTFTGCLRRELTLQSATRSDTDTLLSPVTLELLSVRLRLLSDKVVFSPPVLDLPCIVNPLNVKWACTDFRLHIVFEDGPFDAWPRESQVSNAKCIPSRRRESVHLDVQGYN